MSNRRIFSKPTCNRLKPVVTRWYERLDSGEVFEVIAVDDVDGVVDVQNLDGEVAEMNIATWRKLNLIRVTMPDWSDYRSPFDIDRDVATLNVVWEQWQQESKPMH